MSPAEIEKLKALEREAQKGLGKNGMVYESFEAAARWQARDHHAGLALPRLLEERERLLEALRDGVRSHEPCVPGSCWCVSGNDAIRFAEEKST